MEFTDICEQKYEIFQLLQGRIKEFCFLRTEKYRMKNEEFAAAVLNCQHIERIIEKKDFIKQNLCLFTKNSLTLRAGKIITNE